MINDLTLKQCHSFITLPGESLIAAKRQHPIILIFHLLATFSLTLLTIIFGTYLLHFLKSTPEIYLSLGLVSFAALISFLVKEIIDWHYHFYLITNRKIVEIIATPFFSDVINEVFLDQVRTTEVDVRIRNLLFELLNIGDIIVSFDHPSRDAMFELKNIGNPYGTGLELAEALEDMMQRTPVWFKRDHVPDLVKFAEDSHGKAFR